MDLKDKLEALWNLTSSSDDYSANQFIAVQYIYLSYVEGSTYLNKDERKEYALSLVESIKESLINGNKILLDEILSEIKNY